MGRPLLGYKILVGGKNTLLLFKLKTMPNEQTKQIMIPSNNYFSPAAWNVMVQMANVFIKSGALPKHIDNASKLLMILQTGKEMGLRPMQSINGIYILDGKVALYSHVMLSKVLEGGVKLKWIKDSPTEVEVEFSGLERTPYVSKFTIAEATKANLIKPGGAWTKYPAAMLRARAVSAGARVFCPDLISGAYTLEEVADVDVDDEGKETIKNIKNLDERSVDPHDNIRLQIGSEIKRLGGNPMSNGIFKWIFEKTKLDLHKPENFSAILTALQKLSAPEPVSLQLPQTPNESASTQSPTEPAKEVVPEARATDNDPAISSSPSKAEDAIKPEIDGAQAFDRALTEKASHQIIVLFKSLLEQKIGVPRDDLTTQLTYLHETQGINIEKLEDLTKDEGKKLIETLTKTKVETAPPVLTPGQII